MARGSLSVVLAAACAGVVLAVALAPVPPPLARPTAPSRRAGPHEARLAVRNGVMADLAAGRVTLGEAAALFAAAGDATEAPDLAHYYPRVPPHLRYHRLVIEYAADADRTDPGREPLAPRLEAEFAAMVAGK